MANLTAIRNALANSITTYTGLRADAQARDQVSPPCCVIIPGNPLINYASTMDGAVDINLLVLLIISDAAPVDATQRALDAYLGVDQDPAVGSSVPEAIEKDNTLGGTVHYIQAVNAGQYGRIEYNGVTYFGARISCVIGAILWLTAGTSSTPGSRGNPRPVITRSRSAGTCGTTRGIGATRTSGRTGS